MPSKSTTPSLTLFTTPHSRGRTGSKWGEFFRSMEMEEIKLVPTELQEKKSLQGYVPADIRKEFVFRTNPGDGKRYVARLPQEMKPKRAANGTSVKSSQKPQEARSAPQMSGVVSKSTPTQEEAPVKPVKVTIPGPPKQFDAAD